MSAYARQFLDQLPKPRVESIDGLSPAIAIEQKALGKSPRSTVGTVTEIADYLRLLFARAGVPHCPKSGKVLRAYTVQEIVDTIFEFGDESRVTLLAPLVRNKKGDLHSEIEALRREGYVRARIDGQLLDLGSEFLIEKNKSHDLDVVVDRIVVREGTKGRVTDSVELALKLGDSTVLVDRGDGAPPLVLSEKLVSWEYGITLPPLEPRLFSFNSPHGACPVCDGLGTRSTIDPVRIIPDDSRTLRTGAVAAFGRRGSIALATEVARVVEQLGADPDVPWSELPEPIRTAILYGTVNLSGRRRRSPQGYEGIVARLEKLLETGEVSEGEDHDSDDGAIGPEDVHRFVVTRTCEACGGLRLRPEALSVKLGALRHRAFLEFAFAQPQAGTGITSANLSHYLLERPQSLNHCFGKSSNVWVLNWRWAGLPLSQSICSHAIRRRGSAYTIGNSGWRRPCRRALRP